MKRFTLVTLMGLSAFSTQAPADLTDILRETDHLKPTFAVYDIRGEGLTFMVTCATPDDEMFHGDVSQLSTG